MGQVSSSAYDAQLSDSIRDTSRASLDRSTTVAVAARLSPYVREAEIFDIEAVTRSMTTNGAATDAARCIASVFLGKPTGASTASVQIYHVFNAIGQLLSPREGDRMETLLQIVSRAEHSDDIPANDVLRAIWGFALLGRILRLDTARIDGDT